MFNKGLKINSETFNDFSLINYNVIEILFVNDSININNNYIAVLGIITYIFKLVMNFRNSLYRCDGTL